MKVEKKSLPKSLVELIVEIPYEDFEPYIKQGAERVSNEVKIEGFRPGKVPYEILKQKIGEMTILEETARIVINKKLESIIKEHLSDTEPIGDPKIEITKLAPSNPLEFKVTTAIMPEMKLGDYKNTKVKERRADIKEEDIDKMINDLQEYKVKEVISENEIKDGDKVIVDIRLFLDNVPIEGGQGQDTAIIVGKNYIIPGFDKKLIGAKKGEEREFELPYPADHHMKNLAGKMVAFKTVIKDVYSRELPELNDEFAASFGAKKMPELRDNIKKSLADQAEKENKQIAEKEMLEKIIEKSRFNEIPELLVENESRIMMSELEQAVASQGGHFEDYLASLNKTEDQLIMDLLPDAVKRVKISLLLHEVSKTEKIVASEEEVGKHLEEMKKYYKTKPDILERIQSHEYVHYIEHALTSRKVIDKLREWNID